MSALSKAEIVDTLCGYVEVDKKDAKELVEVFFDAMKETLAGGDSVRISGFGNFILRDKRSRPGRNPRTGESVTVAARRVVTFKAGMRLKDLVALLDK